MEGLDLLIHYLAAYLYAGNGLVALTQPKRLQRTFDVLAGLFDRVVLRTNALKTVSIDCQTYHTPGHISLEAYERWTTGTGPTFRERQRWRVACPKCGVEIDAGLLMTHCQSENVVGQGHPPPSPQGGPNLPGLLPYTSARWRGAWEGIRIRPTYGFTLRTAMRGTQ